jgi:hypothetical protein
LENNEDRVEVDSSDEEVINASEFVNSPKAVDDAVEFVEDEDSVVDKPD